MWHPNTLSAQGTSPSERGATATTEGLIPDATYVKLPRSLLEDIYNKKLNTNEFLILTVLYIQANYRNALIHTSYPALSHELQGKFSVNHITKIFRRLKSMGYIDFKPHQGSRGVFKVQVNNFYLGKAEMPFKAGPEVCSSRTNNHPAEKVVTEAAEAQAELGQSKQRLKPEVFGSINTYSVDISPIVIRGTNNDNRNDIYKKANSISFKGRNLDTRYFEPQTSRESECLEMAKMLGEKSMGFILVAANKYPFPAILDAFDKTMNSPNVRDKCRYFNMLVAEFGAEKDRYE